MMWARFLLLQFFLCVHQYYTHTLLLFLQLGDSVRYSNNIVNTLILNTNPQTHACILAEHETGTPISLCWGNNNTSQIIIVSRTVSISTSTFYILWQLYTSPTWSLSVCAVRCWLCVPGQGYSESQPVSPPRSSEPDCVGHYFHLLHPSICIEVGFISLQGIYTQNGKIFKHLGIWP